VGGARGQAIRRGLEDQLGLVATEVEPFGLSGSAGSTPLRITVAGDPPRQLFGKLYARSHLRSDRWYKLGRELLYGRLEDEKPFNTVRRLVQQEDYALSLMQRAGLPSPTPHGFVELTPEREYLLVAEFFAGATELGEAQVDDQVIDDGLGIIRKLWDAGLAHRDIKPANLLVRDGRMLLIDVAFVQARPSPWRQGVDLANMMLCLALRSSPELVYRRALGQFTVEEITEGFAAAHGLALPSQLRRMLKAQGRDLHAEFLRLLPSPPQPVSIQRWTMRRVGLMAGTAFLAVVLVAMFLSLAGPLRPPPAGWVVGDQRGRQRRPVGDHPGPRPDRRRRDGGQAHRRLRRRAGRRAGLRPARSPALPAGRAPGARLQRRALRRVPRRLRDHPDSGAGVQQDRGHGRGSRDPRLHPPPAARPGPRAALRRPAPARSLDDRRGPGRACATLGRNPTIQAVRGR
jgi:tRNA A-37 threonylcarbamoyl transferase component Bud32